MRIIHIASFKGNFGDILNHNGFYSFLKSIISDISEIKQVELREFYYSAENKKNFDKEYAEYINTFDLCVFGGGGSGTAGGINLQLELL